ncbi:MAG TPA: G8 domain-containing protein, partial [Gemmataceae bacterium]|nr:G8 domain-containing protein [Gemmataceae bacterium]
MTLRRLTHHATVALLLFTLAPAGDSPGSAAEQGKAAPTQLLPLIRSARSGPWSAPQTWEGGKVPAALARVQIRQGHRVVYDLRSDDVMRFVHIAGTLTFAADRDTRLNVGLIKIQAGDDATEDGFDCDGHIPDIAPGKERPAL